jgi:hypothetical protein
MTQEIKKVRKGHVVRVQQTSVMAWCREYGGGKCEELEKEAPEVARKSGCGAVRRSNSRFHVIFTSINKDNF